MSNKVEQYSRLNTYKELFNKKITSTIEQYNDQRIELFKNNISKAIKSIKEDYKDKQQIDNSEKNEIEFMDFLNKKMDDEINKTISNFNKKCEKEVKNTIDSELTTFLNKTLFMIFDIKRKQEQTTEMMISNLINHSPYMNVDEDNDQSDEDDDNDEDDSINSGNEEEHSIKRFLERFNLNSSDNEDIDNLDEINTNCINSDSEDIQEEEEEEEKEEKEEEEGEDEEDEGKEDKEFLNEKTLTDLKAIAKTLDIPLKYRGKHKSKANIINEIYEKEKEESKN